MTPTTDPGPPTLPYRHPAVRDLAWLMAAPGLLQTAPPGQSLVTDDWCRQVYARHAPRLHALDEAPAPLLAALARDTGRRLGLYFERLLLYWLQDLLGVQQLRHNLPVFQAQAGGGKRTLGAFDVLFRETGRPALQHWEATVKFYLQKTDAAGRHYWIGPGERDRLDIKLARLFRHQLTLSARPEARDCLQALGGGPVQAAALVRGYLFYPLNDAGEYVGSTAEAAYPLPCALSPRHGRGWWLQWGARPLPFGGADTRWAVLPKSRWLAPLRCGPDEEQGLLDEAGLSAQCRAHFRHHSRPLLVAALHWRADAWQEVSRGFVLAPD